MNGVITLGEMHAKGMTMLEAACRRCERRGRLSIARLIAEHGDGVLWVAEMVLKCSYSENELIH